jgi:hypothetical protein
MHTPRLLELFILFLFCQWPQTTQPRSVGKMAHLWLVLLWMVLLTPRKKQSLPNDLFIKEEMDIGERWFSHSWSMKRPTVRVAVRLTPGETRHPGLSPPHIKAFLGKRISLFGSINLSKSMSCICIRHPNFNPKSHFCNRGKLTHRCTKWGCRNGYWPLQHVLYYSILESQL